MRFSSRFVPVLVVVLGSIVGCAGSDDATAEPSEMDSSTDSHEQDENTTEEGGQENPDSGTSLTDSGSLEADSADCVDECEIDGERACHEDGIRTCGHYDTDSCLEWSPVEACPEQQTCDPSTVTCQEDEGEPLAPFSIIL
ncbi:MAG TPA: hypothetical protein PL065_11095, partial [Polyangiaceae bacterium]|nr:hypothetical protein [Polyangiaceae bacterium]